MLDRFSRRVYASVREGVEKAVGDALVENQGDMGTDEEYSLEDVEEVLNDSIGEALTDVAHKTEGQLATIAQEMMPGEDYEEDEDPDVVDEEEEELEGEIGDEEEEEEEEEEEPEMDEELEDITTELEGVKAKLLAQSARLAKKGLYDEAAVIKSTAKKI